MTETTTPDLAALYAALARKVDEIHAAVVRQGPSKEFYTPKEAAEALGRKQLTVREWCRLGRIAATKREVGRSGASEWSISREELDRFRNHGLLPLRKD